mgnify:CR=1 FL=1
MRVFVLVMLLSVSGLSYGGQDDPWELSLEEATTLGAMGNLLVSCLYAEDHLTPVYGEEEVGFVSSMVILTYTRAEYPSAAIKAAKKVFDEFYGVTPDEGKPAFCLDNYKKQRAAFYALLKKPKSSISQK